jgi:lysophospholipase L1-like esterase
MNPMLLRPTLLLVCLFAASVFCGEPSLLVKNLSSGKKQHLIVYGTSLTAGGAWVGQVKTALEKKFPGLLTVTNSAKGGMWSKWGVENLDEKVLKLKPDTVIIEFAINDAFAKYATPVDAAKKNLETMIERIQKENPAAEVILMTMNPPTKNITRCTEMSPRLANSGWSISNRTGRRFSAPIKRSSKPLCPTGSTPMQRGAKRLRLLIY